MSTINPKDVAGVLASMSPPAANVPTQGGLQFRDAAAILATVVDNGVGPDDPRVLQRANEAVKIVLDEMIPVGGMAIANITANQELVVLPPGMENAIEAYPTSTATKVRGDGDITQSWYEIVNNSSYLDPSQQHDNPLQDLGLWAAPWDGYSGQLVRVYIFPGLQPPTAQVTVTGAKRFVPMTSGEDFLIVQNLEALKQIIQSIERYENNDPDNAQKFRAEGLRMLQAEVKKHIMDPRNYMRRKSEYLNDIETFAENSVGYVRGQLAIDMPEALMTGKNDLLWSINQVERRIMQKGIYKDCIVPVQATVVGGFIYFPIDIGSVLEMNLNGVPIPVRSQFFEYQENGPGMFAAHAMLIDQGDEVVSVGVLPRRKYKLIAPCTENQCITAICKLRWRLKKPEDIMVIKNYEAIRMMVSAKFLEEKKDWQNSVANQQQAFQLLDQELKDFLSGIKHTIHVQTTGFGLGDMQHGTL